MECPQGNGKAADLAIAFMAGSLAPEKQIAFERHTQACQACRELVDGQKAVWEALDAWKPAPAPADFNARLYQRIAEESKAPWWRRFLYVEWHGIFRPAVPIVAACAALTIAFLVREPAKTPHAPAQQKVSIEQLERALDDMDMLKQISTPVNSDEKSRIL